MKFFEQQKISRRKTIFLLVVYVLGLAAIVCLVYFAVLISLSWFYHRLLSSSYWHPMIFFLVAFQTLAIIWAGTILKMDILSEGGKIIAESLGGVLVAPNTRDFLEKRLLNVVEEMAIASGVPVPAVYLLPSENGINAFAAGTTIDNTVIGVTRGCLNLLSRQELQGVVAHEFSHILNGDMRLNLKLIGVLNGLLILLWIGSFIGPAGGVGQIGVFFARIIRGSVSREREFLADASAIQFTRYPDGISGALKKIGSLQQGSNLVVEKAEEASHLFFASGLSFSFLFATHPPLTLRIKKIEPSFDGVFAVLNVADMTSENTKQAENESNNKGKGGMLLPGTDAVRDNVGGTSFVNLALVAGSEVLLDSIGSPIQLHLEFAAQLRSSIPVNVIEAAHEPLDAQALVLALLIVSSESPHELQTKSLSTLVSQEIYYLVLLLLSELKPLGVSYRLPLIELCIPALKTLSEKQNKEFMKVVGVIIDSDNSVSLFEYVLSRILANRMKDRRESEADGFFSLAKDISKCESDCYKLFAVVARTGTDDYILQETAFAAGVKDLNLSSRPSIVSMPSVSLGDLDAVFETLRQTSLNDRKKIVRACYHVIWADKEVTLGEAELFRAISDSLDIPVPPVLA